jgi:hypothetical protein
MITAEGAMVNIVNRNTIQWSMETDMVLISSIGKSAGERVWLVNRIDVTEGGFGVISEIKMGEEILGVTDKLDIPEILINKIS